MVPALLPLQHLYVKTTGPYLVIILGVLFFLGGCTPGGDSGSLSASPDTSPQLEQEAIMHLVRLYGEALQQEDIDRLQVLLLPPDARAPAAVQQTGNLPPAGHAFLEARRQDFLTRSMTRVLLPDETVQVAPDRRSVTMFEVDSSIDLATLDQRTHLFRTTLHLAVHQTDGVHTVYIAAVHRSAQPLIQVSTPGRVQTGALSRIVVTGTEEPFRLAGVDLTVPDDTNRVQTLLTDGRVFYGAFTAPALAQPLSLHLRGPQGESFLLLHHYRLSVEGERFPQPLADTVGTRLAAVTVAPDGTVWAGGDGGATLYQVRGGGERVRKELLLPMHLEARVEDLIIDQAGRLHVLLLDLRGKALFGQQVQVYEPRAAERFCPTVDIIDPAYPFHDAQGRPLASTRLAVADGRQVWLTGSNGGVTRVSDAVHATTCAGASTRSQYDPVFRRQPGALSSNVVPAVTRGADGALWFGTIFGVSRLHQGQWTAMPFDPVISLQGSVATLERFFQEVAEAIIDAQPLVFVIEFGGPVIKEDLVFSLLDDAQGHLWVGTLGGGIRRMTAHGSGWHDTLHLTRTGVTQVDINSGQRTVVSSQGLISNIVFALAMAPDGTLWAATDEGASRIHVAGDGVTITNVSAADGLPLPVRDVACDGQSTAWLATEGGLIQMAPQGGTIQGLVRDAAGNPVAGVDIIVIGTRFRVVVVTDATGHFYVQHVPSGTYRLQIDSTLATAGPFFLTERTIVVTTDTQILDPIVLSRPGEWRLADKGGNGQTGTVGKPLSEPLVVGLLDTVGQGVPNVELTVAVTRGNGSVVPDQAVRTDAQGNVTLRLTLGTMAGINEVTVTAPEELPGGRLSLVFTVIGEPEQSTARLRRVSGSSQSAPAGVPLPLPLVVRLEDQYRNPFIGIAVTARIRQGDGMLTTTRPESQPLASTDDPLVVLTNERGEAQVLLRIGSDSNQRDIIVEVAVPDLPGVQPVQFLAIVGMVDIIGQPRDIAVAGSVAYVAAGTAGLQVVDVSNVRDPQVVDIATLTDASYFNVAVATPYAYAATFTPTTLTVLDIVTPTAPVVLGTPLMLDQASNPVKLVLDDTFAYLALDNRATGTGTLSIFELTDPATPLLSGVPLALPKRPTGLAVVDGFAYISLGLDGLQVVDVRDPSKPREVTTMCDICDDVITLTGITSVGHTAYVMETDQLSILDLSTPTRPVLRGFTQNHALSLPFTASTIAVTEGFAYVASFDLGLQVFDVRDAAQPQFVGSLSTRSVAFNIAAVSDTARTLIYVTDLAGGLNIAIGPPGNDSDTDGDGVINFFDAFPTDHQEQLNTDGDSTGDKTGDKADDDDDNDGALDQLEEQEGTDPLNPKDFPVACRVPEAGHTIFVDANADPAGGDGTAAAPYRAISTALKAVACLRQKGVTAHLTVSIGPGIYSALSTLESFPLRLRDANMTLQGAGNAVVPVDSTISCGSIPPQAATSTIIDAAFFSDVLDIFVAGPTVADLVLQHGVNGIVVNAAAAKELTLRQNRVTENRFIGVSVGPGVTGGTGAAVTLQHNQIDSNGARGLEVFSNTTATVVSNLIHCNGEEGVFVFDAALERLEDNLIAANTLDGIELNRASAGAIVDNTIRDNKARGLLVICGADAPSVRRNVITDNMSSGVIVQTDESPERPCLEMSTATLVENDIRNHTQGAGILVSGRGVARLTANRVQGNGFGVVVQRGAQATITAGEITHNMSAGIFITDSALGADIALAGPPLRISLNGTEGIDVTCADASAPVVTLDLGNIDFTGGNQGEDFICPGSCCHMIP